MRNIRKDLDGRIFGCLTVIERDPHNPQKWLCRCDCGNTVSSYRSNLNPNGNSKHRKGDRSCGCQRRKWGHGLSQTGEYKSWQTMIARCNDPRHKNHFRYHRNGIVVCERWVNSVENFVEDMGSKPTNKHTLDRIDNKLGYFKQNCRWATMKEQNRNHSKNVIIEYKGISKCIAEWAEVIGIKAYILRSRLKYGWSINDVFEKEPNRNKRREIRVAP